MEKIQLDMLKVFYDNRERITGDEGWADSSIFSLLLEKYEYPALEAALEYITDKDYVKKITKKISKVDYMSYGFNSRIPVPRLGVEESYRITSRGIDEHKKEMDEMALKNDMQTMIDSDIIDLQQALADRSNTETLEYAKLELYKRIGNQYDPYIPNFGMGLYGYISDYHLYDDVSGSSLIDNLRTMLSKLNAFKAMGYPAHAKNSGPNIVFSPSITNTNQVNVNITFQEARRKIEDMGSLSTADTSEALQKIDELEQIVASPENKKSKWEKVKPFLVWLADKGVDVGIALLPLLLNIH